MKTQLVISDLTRMYKGRVCIAGYTKQGECIRPVLPGPGIPEASLYDAGRPIIYPFSIVELDLLNPVSEPPHTEDWLYDIESRRYLRDVNKRQEFLEWKLFDSVETIFEQKIHSDHGFYVMRCQGPRSLGTIRTREIIAVRYAKTENMSWDYRITFSDQLGKIYRLKIVDLTWQYFCRHQRSWFGTQKKIASEMTRKLQSSQVYLRIGLARGWAEFPDRCYLQVTGVYTFPDYLEGKTFADFIQRPVKTSP